MINYRTVRASSDIPRFAFPPLSRRDRFLNYAPPTAHFPHSADKEVGKAVVRVACPTHCNQFDGLDIAILLFAERSVR